MSRRFRLLALAFGISWMALFALAGTAAGEDGNYPVDKPNDTVLGNDVTPQGNGSNVSPAAEDSLPLTGGDVIGLTMVGLGAVGVGYAMVRLQKRADV